MANSVENLLLKNNIPFKQGGRDLLITCLNPDHEDSNPSLRVDKLSGRMNCFSCGFSGNLFKHFGVEQDLRSTKVFDIREKIRKIRTTKFDIPLGAQPFREEGYRGISLETFKQFGAFTHAEQYPDRVVFPLKDARGVIVGFIARYVWSDADPKYLFYPKKLNVPIFPAIPKAENGAVVLVEGIFDFLNLYDKGLKNTICAFGISNLFSQWREKLLPLKILGITKIYILFDKGANKQAERLAKTIKEEFVVEVLDIAEFQQKDSEDPGDFARSQVRLLNRRINEKRSVSGEGTEEETV